MRAIQPTPTVFIYRAMAMTQSEWFTMFIVSLNSFGWKSCRTIYFGHSARSMAAKFWKYSFFREWKCMTKWALRWTWPFANSVDTSLWQVSQHGHVPFTHSSESWFGLSFPFTGEAEYDAMTEDKIVTEISHVVGDARNLDDDIIHLFAWNYSSN